MHPILISIGSFHLPTYGVLLVLAILGGIYTAMRLGRRVGLDSALILDFCTWMILVALVGAKVLMVLTEWNYYRANPGEIFSFSTLMAGGVFYGGFLAALFFTIWYVRVQKISFWKLADVLAPGVALGQSVGRLGCFSAGCDYGKPTTAPWGVVFTSNFAHEVAGVPLGVRLHPAQLYESFATFVIFGLLAVVVPQEETGRRCFSRLHRAVRGGAILSGIPARGRRPGICFSSPAVDVPVHCAAGAGRDCRGVHLAARSSIARKWTPLAGAGMRPCSASRAKPRSSAHSTEHRRGGRRGDWQGARRLPRRPSLNAPSVKSSVRCGLWKNRHR